MQAAAPPPDHGSRPGLGAGMAARVQQGVRRGGMLLAGIVLLIVAAGFITVAIWMLLVAAWSPLVAALVLGGMYLGFGVIMLAMAQPPRTHDMLQDSTRLQDGASASHKRAQSPLAGPAAPFPPLAEAFVFGLETALRLRRTANHPRSEDHG